MGRMKRCPRCGSLIQPHEATCSFCFVDILNSKKPKEVIDKILTEL